VSRLFAGGVLVLAVVSAGLGVAKVWPALSDARSRETGLSKTQAKQAIWRESPLPPALYDFWRAQLRRGERYFVAVRPTGEQSLVKPIIVRAYAAYWLLPAIEVRAVRQAKVVLTFRVDASAFRGHAVCRRIRFEACVVR
jgi:hypothetical protein